MTLSRFSSLSVIFYMPYRPLRAYGRMKIYLKICLKKKRTLFKNMPCSIVRCGKRRDYGLPVQWMDDYHCILYQIRRDSLGQLVYYYRRLICNRIKEHGRLEYDSSRPYSFCSIRQASMSAMIVLNLPSNVVFTTCCVLICFD